MKKKPLSETNPYLRDSQSRLHSTVISVASSSAIEGIHLPYSMEDMKEWEKIINSIPGKQKNRKKTG